MRSLRTSAALLLGLAALLAAGCGDDDDSNDASPPDTTDDSQEPDAEEPQTVAVTAVDYGFEDLPASVPVGSQLTLTNESETEVHELVAIRIPDGEDRPVEELAALPEAELEAIFPSDQPPATVVIAMPGEEGMPVLGDGTLSESGRYALVCFIPTGADPQEYMAAAEEAGDGPPQVDGGPPHLVHGMAAELTVE